MAQKSCSYSFTGPDGRRVVLRGQAAIKAWLVAGGLEYLRGAADDARASKARDITDTPEFKQWFGDSKVVDAEGKPLVVYHGTKGDFGSFETTAKRGAPGPAPRSAGGQFLDGRSMFFFTDSPGVASDYAVGIKNEDGANVIPVYISLKNPLIIDGRGKNWSRYDYQVKQAFDSGNYDGAIVRNVDDNIKLGGPPSDVYVAFRSTQIKSATGNSGAFSPADPDITRSAERGYNDQLPRGTVLEPTDAELALESELAAAEQAAGAMWGEARNRVIADIVADLKKRPSAADLSDKVLASIAQTKFFSMRQDDGDEAPEFAEYRKAAARVDELRQRRRDMVARRIGPPEFEGMPQLVDMQRPIVETDAFKRWFRKSKVVDKDGRPLIAFHGTNRDITAFRTVMPGDRQVSFNNWLGELGSWFAAPSQNSSYDVGSAEGTAEIFAEMRGEEGAAVYPVFLSIQNPYEVEGYETLTDERDAAGGAKTFREKLIAEGYDGIVVRDSDTDGGQYRDDWVAFEPTQIKSAIGNSGEFDPQSQDIRRSADRSLWYSQLARAIESIPARLDNQSGMMWAQWLKANAAKLGVKQDEITWSGIEDFLKLKGKAKVSKDEIGAYLAEGGVRVEEVVLGDGQSRKSSYGVAEVGEGFSVVDGEELIESGFDTEQEAWDWIERQPDVAGKSKYSQYTLPGGTNYREVLLTLPERGAEEAQRRLSEARIAYRQAIRDDKPDEELDRLKAVMDAAAREVNSPPVYKSGHWDQKNILAHIRLNDRTDADGRRVLFVEELQSDWGQQAKKRGFKQPPGERNVQPGERDALISLMQKKTQDKAVAAGIDSMMARDVANRMGHDALASASGMQEQYEDLLRREGLDRQADYKQANAVPAAPFIGKTEGWLNLALKRVIKMAVDEAYDAVAFVNGEQSAERYDLSKQVKSIGYTPNGDGTFKLYINGMNNETLVDEKSATLDRIESLAGKEIAAKVSKGEGRAMQGSGPDTGFRSLTGLDLKVGGEGMKAFYDQIVPQAAGALVKKLGGEGMASVAFERREPAKVSARDPRWRYSDFVERERLMQEEKTRLGDKVTRTEQPGFDITPAMREAASGPLPLFSRERGWDGFPDAVIASPLSAQNKDADYTAAKAGDVKAASRLVGRVLPQEAIDQVRRLIGDLKPVVLPVSAEEAAGRNKIPLATAARLAGALNLDIDVDIVQATRARRSGADGMARLGLQPEFDGQVQSGRDYLLVDDTLTQGGTLAQLKTYVEAGGGRVIGAFALGGKQYSAKIGLDADTLSRLRDKYGSIEDWWRSELGFGFHGLTQSEARYILASGLAPEALRDRVAAARREAGASQGDARLSRERTETPEFKAWFKDSKVVDEQGRPLVVYHGIPHEFEGGAFRRRKSRTGNDSLGFHFGTSLAANDRIDGAMERAKQFPNLAAYEGIAPAVMPVYLSIRNPARLEDIGAWHKAEWVNKALERAGIDAQAPTLAKIKARLVELGYDGVVYLNKFEGSEKDESYIALDPRQIKSAIGNDGSFDETDPSILSSAARSWETPGASKFDDAVQKLQDKNVDLLRVQQALKDAGVEIANDRDAYLKEELFHGRAAKRTEDFTKKELEPLTEEMAKRGLTIEELDEYLHARHAPEANRLVAERNPDVEALQDGGSGMTDKQAADYMAGLAADKREHLQAVAAQVDKMLARTRKLMVDYELESGDTVKGWGEMFDHYVPLMREDDGDAPARIGTGQGYSIKGREVKSRTGSTKKVVDILANIALQRERTIVRGEKNRVGQALVNLARENPNKDFWEVDLAPTTPTYDPKKGVVVQRPDPMFKMRPNVLVAKFREADGSVKEHAVIFNEKSERALRAAASLKNLEAARMEGFLGGAAAVTRYFSAIVTQYNPVFGIINFMRDFQAVMLNLKSTPLDGLQKQIAADSMRATKQIYQNLRSGKDDGDLQKLWDEFRNVGGQTGFRQLYADSADRADAIREAINPDAWTDTKLGKIFTANGVLKVPMAKAMRASKGLFQWLTDYNDTLENATRLAVYKAGKAKFLADGMAEQEAMEKAASIAKNISANFNRKGELGQQIGALYAFFNAAMQGTARLGQLLFDMEPGKPKTIHLSRVGKRIVTGGVLLGVGQALALAAAGFSDDDPPEFVRERSLVIPTGGKSYISIPMPLGLHVLPNIGRMTTEWAMSGFDKTPQRAVAFMGLLAEAFVPTGSSGLSMQTLAPTAVDPLVALTENRDWQGRPIAKESMNPAIPGHALVKDTATAWSRVMAEAINYATGGNQYLRGAVSPTPDQLDYLIAALGGGVANEISKVQQTAGSLVTGESLPTYKIPLVGRLVGNAASQQSEGTAFYSTSRKLNELETEIKGLQADGRQREAQELRASRPEAYLIAQVNRAERDISKLRKQKSELIAAGAPREQVRAIEEKITARMAAFNQAAAAAQARRAT